MEIIIKQVVAKRDGLDVPRDRYEAYLDGDLLCVSRTPFLTGARELLARGVSPMTELTMRREHEKVWSLRSTVGEAAKWEVGHDRFRPYEVPAGSSAAENDF